MEYLTARFRGAEESAAALLLQQYVCRRAPVCFACIASCEGENGQEAGKYMTGRLLLWCRRFPWRKAVIRPERWMRRAEGQLRDEIRCAGEELRASGTVGKGQEMKLTAFLGIGEELLALGEGQRLYLLSTAFGRGAARRLEGEFRGCLEPGAGILLATDSFLENVTERELGEVLRPPEIKTEVQAEKRLRELAGKMGDGAGGGASGAVFLTAGDCYV